MELADLVDRNTPLCVALICGCLLPLAVLEAHRELLTNDEVYTVHIAQAPSLRAMVSLAREIDLHPPLHYLAQRIALHSGLPRWLASRLPSVIAALAACLALFRWTTARFGNLYGLAAVGVLWLTPLMEWAWSNRPYMLWIAWLCLLLPARDAAVRAVRPRWALPGIFLLTLAMAMTHMIGVACIGAFLVAEFWRARRDGRVDWPLVTAFSLPGLCGVGFFYQVHHFTENAFPAVHMPSMGMAADLYTVVVGNTAMVLCGCLAAAVAIFGRDQRRMPLAALAGKRFSAGRFSEDVAALLLALLLLPLLLMIVSAVLHVQFWPRYGLASTPAWAALAVWTVAQRFPAPRVVAIVFVIASTGYMVQRMATDRGSMGNVGMIDGGRRPIPLATLDPSVPIVTASPMTFMEMSDREPRPMARRVFYLTDREAALQYSHYTLFENEDKIRRLLQLPSQTEDLQKFLAEHPRFYVVGDYDRPEVWLLRKLAADGVPLDYLGKYESTYESTDLYLVSR